jgi:SAM-dependent methyltransferase
MPTVADNEDLWDKAYAWPQAGEEWSRWWGGSAPQWLDSIRPRIRRFLPTGTILEIAPGYGRWTHYLRKECEHLIAVDLSQTCIDACRERFADDRHISYHVNDGSSLAMVADASVDLVFSFDSLVHAESTVMERYFQEFARVLSPRGVGFIHHSNAGVYRRYFKLPGVIPGPVREALWRWRILDRPALRDLSMTAELAETYCGAAGLRCISQELVNWGTRRTIDCLTTFTAEASPWVAPNRVVRNAGFMAEAHMIRERARLYPRATPPSGAP